MSNPILGETNGGKFELYALLSEAYGTGLPLGFVLLMSHRGAQGGIQRYLTTFLQHFETEWGIQPLIGLSDKNASEINSMLTTVSKKAHQLCFWNNVTAVRKRLSILCCQPAYYNVSNAREEFPWIDPNFVPVGQEGIHQV